MSTHSISIFKGSCLVAGTMIGGGMLALPILTSQAGFLPALLVFVLAWFFMVWTGLLLTEVSLWMKPKENMISMAGNTLGWGGKAFAWALYLFLFYCLMLAYVVGMKGFISTLVPQVPSFLAAFLTVALFFPVLLKGAHFVGRLNVWLVAGLFLSFFFFVWVGVPAIEPALLKRQDWAYFASMFPIAFTSFAYQGMVPTLVDAMGRDKKRVHWAIWIGSLMAFGTYLIWQALVLGIVPISYLSLALIEGQTAVTPMIAALDNPLIETTAAFFGFFALVTSLLGVSLGLIDFLADGLELSSTGSNRFLLVAFVLIPPALLSLWRPDLFLIALSYAGGIGCALLLGALPILMVARGRYVQGRPAHTAGGKCWLAVLFLFVVWEVVMEGMRIF